MPFRPQVLLPAHASRHPAVTGGSVAILTADNPTYPASKQGASALKQELDNLGFDYEITEGNNYGTPKKSFIVSNPELNKILELGHKLGQESIAYSENGKHQLHYVNGPHKGLATTASEKYQWFDNKPQGNYTAVPGPSGEPIGYFAWNLDLSNPLVPSKPIPMTPIAQSGNDLVKSVKRWIDRLGDLRARELIKTEVLKKVAPPGFSESTMRELKRKHGVESAFKIAWAAYNKKTKKAETSQVNIESSPLKKPNWKPIGTTVKGENDGSLISEVTGDLVPVKKSESDDKESIRLIIEAEEKELKSIKLVDQSWPKQSGRVISIFEELKMNKSEYGKVDPLNGELPKKSSCKNCGKNMSPIVAALRKSKGSVCLGCSSMAKEELKFINNEPQHESLKWNPKIKEPHKNPGSGGTINKTENMPIPSVPKPPQAPGAKPSKAGGIQKAVGDTEPRFEGRVPIQKAVGDTEPRFEGRVPLVAVPKEIPRKKPVYTNPLTNKQKLHKAITNSSLHKSDPGSLQSGLRQASFGTKVQPSIGKVQPKSPAEYNAASFHPTNLGTSALELDTTKRTFAPGHSSVNPINPLSTKPIVASTVPGGLAPKKISKLGLALQGAIKKLNNPIIPIARVKGVIGTPL